MGCYIAWKYREQSKSDFLHSNRTQTGLHPKITVLLSCRRGIPLLIGVARSGSSGTQLHRIR